MRIILLNIMTESVSPVLQMTCILGGCWRHTCIKMGLLCWPIRPGHFQHSNRSSNMFLNTNIEIFLRVWADNNESAPCSNNIISSPGSWWRAGKIETFIVNIMDWRLSSPLKIRLWITSIHQRCEVTGASLPAPVLMWNPRPCQHVVIWTLRPNDRRVNI